jgi:hypothetical protein
MRFGMALVILAGGIDLSVATGSWDAALYKRRHDQKTLQGLKQGKKGERH